MQYQYFLTILKKYKMKFGILIIFIFYHIEFLYLEIFFSFPKKIDAKLEL